MTGTKPLQKLLAWLSPAFPIGGFAWSAGLETAIARRRVHDRATAETWLRGNLAHGGTRNDCILVAEAWRQSADPAAIAALADLCLALIPAAERHKEVLTTGAAFVTALAAWRSPGDPVLPDPCPYPIALGAMAAAHGIAVADTVTAFLTAWAQNQISVAVRLVPIGQTDGLEILAALEPAIATQAAFAASASLDDLGGIAYSTDIAQMQHETLPTRIFRS